MIEHNYYYERFKPKSDCTVWRYMDTAKFLSLLESSALFFANPEVFEDPHEGRYPIANTIPAKRYGSKNGMFKDLAFIEAFSSMMSNVRKNTFINCWHINKKESEAMWQLYLNNDFGIAIQTTYKTLEKALDDTTSIINIGKVKYIDYEKETINENNLHEVFLHKRNAFSHEQELRAVIFKGYHDNYSKGEMVKLDLISLIKNIYISPNAPSWYKNNIESLIKKYGYSFNVIESKMNDIPISSLAECLTNNIKLEIIKIISVNTSLSKFGINDKGNLELHSQVISANDDLLNYIQFLISEWAKYNDTSIIKKEIDKINSLSLEELSKELLKYTRS